MPVELTTDGPTAGSAEAEVVPTSDSTTTSEEVRMNIAPVSAAKRWPTRGVNCDALIQARATERNVITSGLSTRALTIRIARSRQFIALLTPSAGESPS